MQPTMHIAPDTLLPEFGFEKTDAGEKGQDMRALKEHHATR